MYGSYSPARHFDTPTHWELYVVQIWYCNYEMKLSMSVNNDVYTSEHGITALYYGQINTAEESLIVLA